MERRLQEHLDRRRREGTLRALSPLPKLEHSKGALFSVVTPYPLSSSPSSTFDFSSNDYLGLARCRDQFDAVQAAYDRWSSHSSDSTPDPPVLGASGSRLLSGDSPLARSLEAQLARVHRREATLLFNSGYDANLSLLSSLPYLEEDALVMDALVHNSLVMGARMGRVKRGRVFSFRHNDLRDLKRVLEEVKASSSSLASMLVVVESVYSMDGDIAPLKEILALAHGMGASVMVDEAHGLGVYGRTNPQHLQLTINEENSAAQRGGEVTIDGADSMHGGTGVLAALDLESHPALLCSIHTFGKAAGCHGAVVAGSSTLMSYLVNYARPFVYSTALPAHSLISIQQSYVSMLGPRGERRRNVVFRWVGIFREEMSRGLSILEREFPGVECALLPSPSPIQALVVPGNARCVAVCRHLRQVGQCDVYPIRSPTVPGGQERIRIILHAHNSETEVRALTELLLASLRQLMLFPHLEVKSKL